MNHLLKRITTFFCIVTFLYSGYYYSYNFYYYSHDLSLLSTNFEESDSFIFFDQTKNTQFEINPLKLNVFLVLKNHLINKSAIRENVNPVTFLVLRKYILDNDLHFNIPAICYKVPLSEHTEEG